MRVILGRRDPYVDGERVRSRLVGRADSAGAAIDGGDAFDITNPGAVAALVCDDPHDTVLGDVEPGSGTIDVISAA